MNRTINKSMKRFLPLILLLFLLRPVSAQINLDDNETSSPIWMNWSNGTYERGVPNPSVTAPNTSPSIARYVRTNAQYDALSFKLTAPMVDVTPYMSSKKITMDFYSEYPGTVITISLGNSHEAGNTWPIGRHSEYQATTTKTNEWETLTFNHTWQPQLATGPDEITEIILLIDADKEEVSAGRVYYFDNLTGPELTTPPLSDDLYEDADSTSTVNFIFQTATIDTLANNPDPSGNNTSEKVIRYDSNTDDYNVVTLKVTETIMNVIPVAYGKEKMNMQFYSEYPGTEVLISLENSSMVTGTYPYGIHSIYRAVTTKTNEWETLLFHHFHQPDTAVPNMGIDQVVINIARLTNEVRTYYFDNFYGPELFISSGTVDLHINEVMSSNGKTIQDSEGDTGDWIEIYNSGDGSANLKDYALSDDPALPRKYVFPDVYIHPDQYIIIWASDKNKISEKGETHANFKLSADGDPILLTNTSGDTVDYLPPVPLVTDVSYGRSPDGTGEWVYFNEATPGLSNTTQSYNGYVSDVPVFSHPGGFYQESLSLGLSNNDPAVTEIRYTLDGSEPTLDSPLLTGPLAITSRENDPNVLANIRTSNVFYIGDHFPDDTIFKSTTVRARLFSEGMIPGRVVTNSYFVDENMLQRYDMPVWSIVTDSLNLFDYETGIYVPGKLNDEWIAANPGEPVEGGDAANYTQRSDEWEKPASIEFFEPDGSAGFKINAGLKIHGGFSRGNAQKSLRLHFRNRYDSIDEITYPVFPGLLKRGSGKPLTKFGNLVLRNSGGDNSYTMFRDALSHSLISHTSIMTQAYRPSVVFLNGEYWGIHNIRERIDDELIANHFNIPAKDVAILKFNGSLEEGMQEDSDNYSSLLNYAKTANVTTAAGYNNIKGRMDVGNYIDYQVSQIYLDNRDWPGNNILFWRNRNGDPSLSTPGKDNRWRWMFVDTDFGMGWSTPLGYNAIDFATDPDNQEWPNPAWSTLLLRRLLLNQAFKLEFINRFADQLNSSFKPERVIGRIDEMKAGLNQGMQEHLDRWFQWAELAHWESEVQKMRTFATARPDLMRADIMEYFSLTGTADITVDVYNKTGGNIKISSLRLSPDVPGVSAEVYPWTGTYFDDVPVLITAIPDPGYRFIGWNGNATGNQDTTIVPDEAITLVAYFEPVNEGDLFPVAHNLSTSDYIVNSWSGESEPGLYPPSMVFMQSDTIDPDLSKARNKMYSLPYNLSSGTRIEGLGTSGFAFINTGSTSELEPGAAGRDLGAAIVAIKTSGISSASVSFVAGTVLRNTRAYGIRLQYRIGSTGAFNDYLNNGQLVEYSTNAADGHSTIFSNIPLPQQALDQEYVQLRWIYYHIAGDSGPRSKLRLDDIKIQNDDPNAISMKSSSKVSLFPNPSEGIINLSLTNDYYGKVSLTVFDATGKTKCSSHYVKQQKEILLQPNCTFSSSGIYFVKWQAGEEQGFERVVIVDGN